jgi:uncharacterized protein
VDFYGHIARIKGKENTMMTGSVKDNPAKQRFEMEVEGHLAIADYRLEGNRLAITHVEAPEALRGQGVAGKLMEGVVEAARQRQLKIIPICSYAAAWMRRHKEHQDLLGV